MRTFLIGAVAGLAAIVGFASTANASATVDLIWSGSGNSVTSSVATSANIQLNVVLTGGANGISASGVTVNYSAAVAKLSVTTFTNNADPSSAALLPVTFGTTVDNGTKITNFNASAFIPFSGSGLSAGQSYLLATLTFVKAEGGPGTFAIDVLIEGTDALVDLDGVDISSTSTFNGASIVNPAVPEPGTVTLLGLGLGGLALAGRRRS